MIHHIKLVRKQFRPGRNTTVANLIQKQSFDFLISIGPKDSKLSNQTLHEHIDLVSKRTLVVSLQNLTQRNVRKFLSFLIPKTMHNISYGHN